MPPPYPPVQDVMEVCVMFTVSYWPSVEERIVPLPEGYVIELNAHPVIFTLAFASSDVELPFIFTIDALTLTADADSDVTVMEVKFSDPLMM